MMRLTILSITLMFILLLPAAVKAADIPLRAGEHEGYSRLVFDWPENVDYTLKRSEGKLSVAFKKEGALDTQQIAGKSLKNINAVDVISQAPFIVSISIPQASKARDFKIGSRVIIDIYDPPGGAAAAKKLEIGKAPVAPASQPVELSEEDTPNIPEPDENALETVEPSEAVEDAQSMVAAEVLASKEQSPENAAVEEPQPQTIQLKAKSEPQILTVSSTASFGFSAFKYAGNLWTVANRNDALLTPQLSGDGAGQIGTIQPVDLPNPDVGKAFIAPLAQGLRLKGQGGGVAWRVIAANDLKLNDPVTPVREQVEIGKGRSGKLVLPFESASSVVELQDPETGNKIFAVTVTEAKDFSGGGQSYIDFDLLQSPIGAAILPKVDDLKVRIVSRRAEIYRDSGLAISAEDKARVAIQRAAREGQESAPKGGYTGQRIFDFGSWQMGGPESLPENRTLVLGRLKELTSEGRVESLLTLGRAYLANYRGPESLGVFELAAQEVTEIRQSPEFRALVGAGKTLSRRSEEAFRDLSGERLKKFGEINLWRAVALADLGDWQQAAEIMPPETVEIIGEYPDIIRAPIAIDAAEIALRSGNTGLAQNIMDQIDTDAPQTQEAWKAALKYLQGEKARQEGNLDKTKKLWSELADGGDDLYRAKAGLALTRVMMSDDGIKPKQAIDRLERLRYAWRSDDLEAQINYWLGRLYFDNGQYLKGLNIMRDATTYATHPALAQKIANDMGATFVELFNSDKLNTVSALDAITLYEQFSELVPPDKTGDKVVEELAEHLVANDLLGRAGDLLQNQVEHRLDGYEAFRIGTRLAAIRLIDNRPDEAVKALEIAEAKLKTLPAELQNERNQRAVKLLRARALSRQGRPDQALAMLLQMEPNPQVNRLRADIAWNASYWDDAAEALHEVVLDENISLTRPLTESNKSLLIQRAVALNLSNDRVALANMRERYTELMAQTDKAKIFEIITRPRQNITLADRETLLSIVSEVDLFESILNGIKNGDADAADDEQ